MHAHTSLNHQSKVFPGIHFHLFKGISSFLFHVIDLFEFFFPQFNGFSSICSQSNTLMEREKKILQKQKFGKESCSTK